MNVQANLNHDETVALRDTRHVLTIDSLPDSILSHLREMWTYRELLFLLAWRDIKVRYKQTAFGIAWAVLQPLLGALLFTIFFGRLAAIPSDGIPFGLFAYAGLLQWTFLSNAVATAGSSLLSNADLITKVYFPRMLIPAGGILAGLVDTLIALVPLFGLMFWYGQPILWTSIFVPFIILLNALLAFAVGGWTAATVARFRDIRHALPFLVQIWMFASPVIYPASLVPTRWRWVFELNPMTGIIEATRSALFGRPPQLGSLTVSILITCIGLVGAIYYFRRVEINLVDII